MSKSIHRAVVAGTGVMGRGIAMLLCEKGIETTLLGRSDASTGAARAGIEKDWSMAVRRRRLTEDEAAQAIGRFATATADACATGADLLIETVVEDLDAKKDVLSRLTPLLPHDALVGTNTSALQIGELAQAVTGPERFLGLHFMNPAPEVALVEIAPHETTSADTVAAVEELCALLGKTAVRVTDRAGFIVNRLLMLLINETARMVEDGTATPRAIDTALRLGCGHPMGPATLADFIGLDVVLHELESLEQAHGERFAPSALLRDLVAKNQLGRKTGGGLGKAGRA